MLSHRKASSVTYCHMKNENLKKILKKNKLRERGKTKENEFHFNWVIFCFEYFIIQMTFKWNV